MSTFVATCRREWRRLGVADAVANEMAADLEADLTEANADGVPPEAVLGNGYFDPSSFAASWAVARGVVRQDSGVAGRDCRRSWMMAGGAVVSAVIALAGLAFLVGRRGSSSVAAVVSRHPVASPLPRVFVAPPGFLPMHQGEVSALVGMVLLLLGTIGLGIALWVWRPWSARRRATAPRQDIGLPSYL